MTKNLVVSLILLCFYAVAFALLGGLEKTGDPRLGVGLATLAPLSGLAYLLNNLAQTRSFGLYAATLAIFLGVTAPVGECLAPVSSVILLSFLFLGRSYVRGKVGEQSAALTWVFLIAQFSTLAVITAWLVHQIF